MNNKYIEAIKKKYPRAYQKWTPEEETLLLEKYQNGVSPDATSGLSVFDCLILDPKSKPPAFGGRFL